MASGSVEGGRMAATGTGIRRKQRTLSAIAAAAMLGTTAFGAPSAAAATAGEPDSPTVITDPTTWYPQIVRAKPTWLPAELGYDATVIQIPGSGDRQSIGQNVRTAGIGFYDDPATGESYDPTIIVVSYPAAIGIRVFGRVISLNDVGVTYNDSVDAGTAAGVADAYRGWDERGRTGTIVLNGYSQSGPVAMNIAYELHRAYAAGDPDAIGDENIVVVIGGDTRFPNTGIETVLPSVIPGVYTNGQRDPASTGEIEVISYCVRGDYVCGLGNPLAHPFETIFYLLPGAVVHGVFGDRVNQYEVIAQWEDGDTTYVVLDGGNPWGMVLRALGVPVPTAVDDVLSALVRVPMPGEQSTVAGHPIPTPREVQEQLYSGLGMTVPTTDPDQDPDSPTTAPTDEPPANKETVDVESDVGVAEQPGSGSPAPTTPAAGTDPSAETSPPANAGEETPALDPDAEGSGAEGSGAEESGAEGSGAEVSDAEVSDDPESPGRDPAADDPGPATED